MTATPGPGGVADEAVAPATPPWAAAVADLCRDLSSDPASGLTTGEAARRLAVDGPNELDASPPVPWWRRLVAQFTDPLVVLLLAAIVVSLAVWVLEGADTVPIDAVVIAAIVGLNAALGFWQERRASDAVAALQQLAAVRTRVVRDGTPRLVANTELVVGDVVVLGEGDAVGADARLVAAADLRIDEASLTGESTPVTKDPAVVAAAAALAERSNMVFSGTAVTRGRGRAVVVATGMASQIGHIAAMVDRAVAIPTPLQRQMDWLGRVLGRAVVVLALVVLVVLLWGVQAWSLATVLDAVLVSVSLAVAAVPEGLPAILSVVLALGVQRLAARKAVVKRLSSVETLGAASVICTDKTGTLTRNEMTIVRIATASGTVEVTGSGYQPLGEVLVDGRPLADESLRGEVAAVLLAGSQANDASIVSDQQNTILQVLGDPTEVAFLVAERKLGLEQQRRRRFARVGEVPFSSARKLMSTLDRDIDGPAVPGSPASGDLVLFTKGAPDVLVARCGHEWVDGEVVALGPDRRSEILSEVDGFADRALRTLSVAARRLVDRPDVVDESLEHDLVLLGTVGITDPPRDEVAAAVREAHEAGIRVVMITGDHPRTAARIAEQLGIASRASHVVTGAQLAAAPPEVVRSTSVFARVAPEHKLGIVESLQADGQVVAMTGDGVNDAPALRQADIGVAMGINGTEVSKEAADMVLADDDFATILAAVRGGREIFDNIRKFLRFLLASNMGEVVVVVVGVVAADLFGLTATAGGLAVPLLATQILWINLVTDGALALALGIDPPVDDVMARPPRQVGERVVDRSMLATIAVIGVTTGLASLAALDLGLPGGVLGGSGDLATARTMAFTTLVLAQVFNALNARSGTVSAFVRPFQNRLLWAAIGVTVALQVAVVHLPMMNQAFSTQPLGVGRWATCVALAATVLVAEDLRKALMRRRHPVAAA